MKKILSLAELERLSTKRLLAYKKSLPYPGKRYNDDLTPKEREAVDKLNKQRQDHIDEVKKILSKREHVEKIS